MSIERLNMVWPEWKVDKQLGEGSFGKVYKITREGHGMTSTAAVKVVSIPQNDAELAIMSSEGMDKAGTRSYFKDFVVDFVNEIKLMELMKGTANIVNVEDYRVLEKKDEISWDIFIRMELLTPLNEYIGDRLLSETEVIKLGIDVCTALERCSQKKIIHRDIKPENIFVSSFGEFKVGDFGIAREMEKTNGSMSHKGTYNYMAPEILAAKYYDSTVDIYSLGIVLYKLLNNNRLPFLDPYAQFIQFQDRKNAIDRRFSGEPLPAPINASPYLARVILSACAFDPAKRFRTPTAFKNALLTVRGEQASPVPLSFDTNKTIRAQCTPKSLQTSPIPTQSTLESIHTSLPTSQDFNATARTRRILESAQTSPMPVPLNNNATELTQRKQEFVQTFPAPTVQDNNANVFTQRTPELVQAFPVPAQQDDNATVITRRMPETIQAFPEPAQQDDNATVITRRMPESAQTYTEPVVEKKRPTAPPRKKRENRSNIFPTVLTTLAFICIIFAGIFFMNPGGILDGIIREPTPDVVAALTEGEFEKALSLAEEVDNDTLHRQLSVRLHRMSAEFLAEEIDYEVATMQLDTIERMDVPDVEDLLNETRDNINNLYVSRIALQLAEALLEDGYYEEAISQYRLVSLDDPNYEMAIEGVGNAANAFRADTLETARSYSNSNDYESAIRILSDALLVLHNDAEIMQELNMKKALLEANR